MAAAMLRLPPVCPMSAQLTTVVVAVTAIDDHPALIACRKRHSADALKPPAMRMART